MEVESQQVGNGQTSDKEGRGARDGLQVKNTTRHEGQEKKGKLTTKRQSWILRNYRPDSRSAHRLWKMARTSSRLDFLLINED